MCAHLSVDLCGHQSHAAQALVPRRLDELACYCRGRGACTTCLAWDLVLWRVGARVRVRELLSPQPKLRGKESS